jgi:outer membrane protein assembly factor BamB
MPAVTLGSDDASRQKCRDAWDAWWRAHGATIDLARLDTVQRLLGYTLVVQMDANFNTGQVKELGPDGKPRWQIDGLRYPLDAQVLPGDRVLVPEYHANRVTERNFKGDVLWEKALTQNPIAAQRLANGHTFIATQFQLFEVDRNGKEVFTHHFQAQPIWAALKARDGRIACITQQGMCLLLDAAGKQLQSFFVGNPQTFGGLDVLPNGRVLVAQFTNHKVVEYDGTGKAVWEAAVQSPTSAVRLANGRTLVASQNMQVVELDRTGKVVWEHKTDGRPWRVRRR